MNLQGVVMNVADLNRSIDFYREVLGFTVLSQEEQLAAMSAPGSDRPQIVVLREFGNSPLAGARHIGLRAFVLDVESADELERIAGDLEAGGHFVGRRDRSEWTAVVGRDPDGVGVVAAWHRGDERHAVEGWKALDDILYGIGE